MRALVRPKEEEVRPFVCPVVRLPTPTVPVADTPSGTCVIWFGGGPDVLHFGQSLRLPRLPMSLMVLVYIEGGKDSGQSVWHTPPDHLSSPYRPRPATHQNLKIWAFAREAMAASASTVTSLRGMGLLVPVHMCMGAQSRGLVQVAACKVPKMIACLWDAAGRFTLDGRWQCHHHGRVGPKHVTRGFATTLQGLPPRQGLLGRLLPSRHHGPPPPLDHPLAGRPWPRGRHRPPQD